MAKRADAPPDGESRTLPPSTMRRKLFVLYYVGEARGNATVAAEMAGFSKRSAYELGSRLLKEPAIAAEVAAATARILDKAETIAMVDKARVLLELQHIALSDPAELFDPVTHKLKSVREMPEHARRALRSVKVKRSPVASEETVEVSFWSKPETLVNLGRELGLTFPTRQEHTGEGGGPLLVQVTHRVVDPSAG